MAFVQEVVSEAVRPVDRRAQPAAAHAGAGEAVPFGSFPSTAFGYVEKGASNSGGGFAVSRFIEKPDATKAQQLLLAGNVLWNAGIFLCTTGTLLHAMDRHAPDILAARRKAISNCARDGDFVRPDAAAFAACGSEIIDDVLIEKHEKRVVFPFNGAWSDVGSWNAVADLTAPAPPATAFQATVRPCGSETFLLSGNPLSRPRERAG